MSHFPFSYMMQAFLYYKCFSWSGFVCMFVCERKMGH